MLSDWFSEIYSQKYLTCLNYQSTRRNRQRICKETVCACEKKHSLVRTTIATEVETRLKVGMLYGGYHGVGNTSWSRPNHSQVHIEKLLYVADTFVAGNTIFWHCVKSWENKSKLGIWFSNGFIWQTSLLLQLLSDLIV